jgi:hypothetical protein
MLLLSIGKIAGSAQADEGDGVEKGSEERFSGALVLRVTGTGCPFALMLVEHRLPSCSTLFSTGSVSKGKKGTTREEGYEEHIQQATKLSLVTDYHNSLRFTSAGRA